MSRIFCIMRIALYETRLMLLSSRFLILSVISYIFMDAAMRPVRQFAADYHLGIVPAVMPFYGASITYANIALLLLILLYSDIPLKGDGQRFLIIRGRSLAGCAVGHVISLIITGVVFVLEQLLFSVITALPSVSFGGGWQKVWGSIASGRALSLGYLFGLGVSDVVIRTYTPIQAVTCSAFLFLLIGCIYALIEFLLNGISRGKLGTVVLSVWSVGWIFLERSHVPILRKLLKYSPQTWNDLSQMEMADLPGKAGFLAAIIFVLALVLILLVKYRKIELVK